MYKRNSQGWSRHLDFILIDLLALQVAFVLGYCFRHGFDSLPYVREAYRTMAITFVVLDLLINVSFNTMHNVLERGAYEEFVHTFWHVLSVMGSMTAYLFIAQTSAVYSRATVVYTTVLYLGLSYVTRMIWKRILKSSGASSHRPSMIVVAPENRMQEVLDRVAVLEDRRVVGVVCTDTYQEGTTIAGIPVVSDLKGAALHICREWVDEVFIYNAMAISVPGSVYDTGVSTDDETRSDGTVEQEQLNEFIMRCRQMGIPVHLHLPLSEQSLNRKSFIEGMGGYQVLTISNNYITPAQAFLKRVMDLAGGIVGSVLALIIMATVGLRIKLASPGPILFKQTRIGMNGKKFTMYKLRSMYIDAEERKAEFMAQNRVADGMMFKLDWDPRIIGNEVLPDGTKKTGIGEFVRRTSLDEFPQFFNVLKGDMSLVGTRPPTVDEWERYEYHHRARLTTKPGITGMWQVSGRSDITDFEEVVRLDTEYIQNWSLGLDLRILVKTFGVVLHHEGAM